MMSWILTENEPIDSVLGHSLDVSLQIIRAELLMVKID